MGADANETALNQTLNFKQLLTRLKSYFWEKTYNRNVYSNNTTEVKKIVYPELKLFFTQRLARQRWCTHFFDYLCEFETEFETEFENNLGFGSGVYMGPI
jgi:hypothetical protein